MKISIGPPIEDGFYYDFDFPDGVTLSDDDFERIEAKMREHIKADEHFEREDVTVAEALDRFSGEGQDYKVELIEDLVRDADPAHPLETVSLYRTAPSPTSAAARTAPARSGSRPSSSPASRARTGAATPAARCSRACTGLPGCPRSSSRST